MDGGESFVTGERQNSVCQRLLPAFQDPFRDRDVMSKEGTLRVRAQWVLACRQQPFSPSAHRGVQVQRPRLCTGQPHHEPQ